MCSFGHLIVWNFAWNFVFWIGNISNIIKWCLIFIYFDILSTELIDNLFIDLQEQNSGNPDGNLL